MKRLPRKLKKKYKKQGLIGLHKWNFKYRNSIREIIDFPSSRYLLTLIETGKPTIGDSRQAKYVFMDSKFLNVYDK